MKHTSAYLIKKLAARYNTITLDKIAVLEPTFVAVIKVIGLADTPYRLAHNGDRYVAESVLLHAISQAMAILADQHPSRVDQDFYLSHIKQCQFHKGVEPGDCVRIELSSETIGTDGPATVHALILVEGTLIGEATLLYTFTQVSSRPTVHPTASIHPTAILGDHVKIGAYSTVGAHVVIGDRSTVEAHVTLEKWTEVGQDCHIFYGAVIGSQAQDTKYAGERSWVKIGNRTVIREYVTINRATGTGEATCVGDDTRLFTAVHIGHNCIIGNDVTIVNLAALGGHVIVEDRAVIGGCVGVHQLTRIGTGAMIGGYSKVHSDVPPYLLCEGNPAEIRTLNSLGLRRHGATATDIAELKQVFKYFFKRQYNTPQAIQALEQETLNSAYSHTLIQFMARDSKRGILKKTADSD